MPFRFVIIRESKQHHPTIIIKEDSSPVSPLIVFYKRDVHIAKDHGAKIDHLISFIRMMKSNISLTQVTWHNTPRIDVPTYQELSD